MRGERAKFASAAPLLLLLAAVVIAVLPVLSDAQYGVLDTPRNYAYAKEMSLWRPATYLTLPKFAGRVTPALPVYFFPAQFVNNATIHFAWKILLFLLLPLVICFWILYRVTGRVWLSAVAGCMSVLNISFVENYYTLFKGEPCIFTGMVLTTWVLWLLLSGSPGGLGCRICMVAAGMLGALLTYFIKETGGVYVAVYLAGLVFAGWASPLGFKRAVKCTAPLTLLQLTCSIVLVWLILRVPKLYGVEGVGTVSLKPQDIVEGSMRIAAYIAATAPYLLFPMLALAAGVALLRLPQVDSAALKPRIAWTGYFVVASLGGYGVYAVWTELYPLYLLMGAAFSVLAFWLGFDLAWYVAGVCTRRCVRMSAKLCAIAFVLLHSAHAGYALLVSHCSEAQARHRADRSYAELLSFLAAHVPSNSGVSLLMDERFPEPRESTILSLDLFRNRKDIRCDFPRSVSDLQTSGWVAVSDYSIPMNYDRMPLHHQANELFYNRIAHHLRLSNVFEAVYDTPIWYATNTYHGPQYRALFGIPAFWDLKRGVYRFGWKVYRYSRLSAVSQQAAKTPQPQEPPEQNLLLNSSFDKGLSGWQPWEQARLNTNLVSLSRAVIGGTTCAEVRVENPGAVLAGIQQVVGIESGKVYRLSGMVRRMAPGDPTKLFGARVACYRPPQREHDIIWMSNGDATEWTRKSTVFTNTVTGAAVIFAHLGYGSVDTRAAFTDIRLEELRSATTSGSPLFSPETASIRVSAGGTSSYDSVWDAVTAANSGDMIIVADGVHKEDMCFTGHPLNPGLSSLTIIGKGRPVIEVTISNVPTMNECALELSEINNLALSNIGIRAVCKDSGLYRVYNSLFNGCVNLRIDDCTFQSEVYGVTNTFKTFVAIAGASNVVVRDSAIITLDMTGSNDVSHTATHDAEPGVFERVAFIGKHLSRLDVGEVVLKDCSANDMVPRFTPVLSPLSIDQVRAMVLPGTPDTLRPSLRCAPPGTFGRRNNLLANATFDSGLKSWGYWTDAVRDTNTVRIIPVRNFVTATTALRIENPQAKLVGLQQLVSVTSGSIYRLSGIARSVATNAPEIVFGGRVAFWLPPQPEHAVVWTSEHNDWLEHATTFTNEVTGTALLYVHMGYGNVASTGEFTDVRLERVE